MSELEPARIDGTRPVVILIDELAHYHQSAADQIGPLLERVLLSARTVRVPVEAPPNGEVA